MIAFIVQSFLAVAIIAAVFFIAFWCGHLAANCQVCAICRERMKPRDSQVRGIADSFKKEEAL